MKTLSTLCVFSLLAVPAFGQEEPKEQVEKGPVAEILKKAQGKWERQMERGGEKLSMIKEIKGNKETVSVYRAEELVSQWSVEFQIKQVDGMNVFTFRNMTITHGRNKGQSNAGPFSYVFKIHKNQWHEIHGLKSDDPREPEITIFQRYDPSKL